MARARVYRIQATVVKHLILIEVLLVCSFLFFCYTDVIRSA
jgi:hypothetical protein